MQNQIEIYQSQDGQTQIEVKFGEETVWLNRNQLADLFGRDVKTIGKHVNNVFFEEELEKSGGRLKFKLRRPPSFIFYCVTICLSGSTVKS